MSQLKTELCGYALDIISTIKRNSAKSLVYLDKIF